MMESSREILVLTLLVALNLQGSFADTRFYVKMRTNSTDPLNIMVGGSARIPQSQTGIDIGGGGSSEDEKSRSTFRLDDETMIRESLKANHERRNSFVESSTFDPDVLNKFLDDYANKMKTTTDKSYEFPFRATKPTPSQENVQSDDHSAQISTTEMDRQNNNTNDNTFNTTLDSTVLNQQDLNDTVKRNKYFGGNNNPNDDRNGWVTLDAIPWSKSKISKWQANPSSQRPWPEIKRWEKPNTAKPWASEFPSRPAYVNNEPWYDNQKPYRPDYHNQDRPSPPSQVSTRPTSYFDDRFDDNPNQAQKWPPERPSSSWEKFPSADSYRPNSDIITDDRPSNFPNSWDKYSHTSNKPNNYPYNDRDRFTNNHNSNNYNQNYNNKQQAEPHDWRDHQNSYPSKFDMKDTNFGRPSSEQGHHYTRPHQSNYQYTPDHPPSHPSTGDGQWVLLSTNHGYSKSRQRSLKYDALDADSGIVKKLINATKSTRIPTKQESDGTVAMMTSKRQVRLTVLPSINGTNTTTSHGGLLEVERTFKTVDQSQKEYEAGKLVGGPMILSQQRPTRPVFAGRPSNSAVLAAVGAGMLPATMAMMIPMMLGRKKRSNDETTTPRDITKPYEFFHDSSESRGNSERKRKKLLRLK